MLLLIVVVSPVVTAWGDGKFFVQEKIPAGIPYQRAFLLHYGGQETLILQSQYDLASSAAIDALGWVVPVPTVPEIAGGDILATLATSLSFWMASMQTQPRLYHLSQILPLAAFGTSLAALLGGLTVLLICLGGYLFARWKQVMKPGWGRWANRGAVVMLLGFIALLILMPILSSLRESGGIAGVDVVKDEQAGIYDVKVIRSQDGKAMVEWLTENGFRFGDEDRRVFQDYADRGWCFVTAKVDPRQETNREMTVIQGLAAPLILKFATQRPLYPLALTATAGTETEILIYTLSETKPACAGLSLRHAKQADARSVLRFLLAQAETDQWPLLRDVPEASMMLCKFKGRLTPAQMKQDLEFTAASDNEPYRERRIVW